MHENGKREEKRKGRKSERKGKKEKEKEKGKKEKVRKEVSEGKKPELTRDKKTEGKNIVTSNCFFHACHIEKSN